MSLKITRETGPTEWGPSKTKQEFTKECDVNRIVGKFQRTGVLPVPVGVQPVFADVSEIGDFASVVRKVKAAENAFLRLDPKIRLRFKNNPAMLLAFLKDPGNREEAEKLGLVEKKAVKRDPAPKESGPPPKAELKAKEGT